MGYVGNQAIQKRVWRKGGVDSEKGEVHDEAPWTDDGGIGLHRDGGNVLVISDGHDRPSASEHLNGTTDRDYHTVFLSTLPDLAVVVHRPGVSIAESLVTGGDAVRSVAADNPAYDPGEPAVVVAFVESGLTQVWPEWVDHQAEGLYAGAQTHHITLYTFPESRLSTVSIAAAAGFLAEPALDMAALETRLVAAGWEVEQTEHGTIVAETMGEQYRIFPTGEIDGDGQIREPWRISLSNTEINSAANVQYRNQLCRRDGIRRAIVRNLPVEGSLPSRGCRSIYAG